MLIISELTGLAILLRLLESKNNNLASEVPTTKYSPLFLKLNLNLK